MKRQDILQLQVHSDANPRRRTVLLGLGSFMTTQLVVGLRWWGVVEVEVVPRPAPHPRVWLWRAQRPAVRRRPPSAPAAPTPPPRRLRQPAHRPVLRQTHQPPSPRQLRRQLQRPMSRPVQRPVRARPAQLLQHRTPPPPLQARRARPLPRLIPQQLHQVRQARRRLRTPLRRPAPQAS